RRGLPPRPILESLPQIHVKTLTVPKRYGQTVTQELGLKLPRIATAKLSCESVLFHHKALHRKETGLTQQFGIKTIRLTFGVRHYFVCHCGKPVIRLYYHSQRLACRHCHFGAYLSQRRYRKGDRSKGTDRQ